MQPDYRKEKLKSRLIERFGVEIGFSHPRYRSDSEIVFLEAIPKGQIIEESLIILEIDREQDFTISVNQCDISFEESVILYRAAKVIRKMILEHSTEIPFLLRPENINEETIQI